MIAVIDYGLGNVQAFLNIYKRLNIPASAVRSAEELNRAEKIVLPGVGAFDWAMSRLDASGLHSCLDDLVMNHKVPVLGVCVGMQMLANRSSEGQLPGLGWVDAEVARFDSSSMQRRIALPHMGWNDVRPNSNHDLFREMSDLRFYFLHSYYFVANNANDVIASTDYGIEFCSAVQVGNVFGTQFHPEKSHHWGVQLLKNFAEM